jgi:hypothetical protein
VLGRPTLKDSALYRARSCGSPGVCGRMLAGFGRDGGAKVERQQRRLAPAPRLRDHRLWYQTGEAGNEGPQHRHFSSSLSADATLLFRPGGAARGGSGGTGRGGGCLRAACIGVDFKASQPPHIARRS